LRSDELPLLTFSPMLVESIGDVAINKGVGSINVTEL